MTEPLVPSLPVPVEKPIVFGIIEDAALINVDDSQWKRGAYKACFAIAKAGGMTAKASSILVMAMPDKSVTLWAFDKETKLFSVPVNTGENFWYYRAELAKFIKDNLVAKDSKVDWPLNKYMMFSYFSPNPQTVEEVKAKYEKFAGVTPAAE